MVVDGLDGREELSLQTTNGYWLKMMVLWLGFERSTGGNLTYVNN